MNLAVFGANGPTGRHVVEQALAAGHRVTAVTRRPDQYPLSSPHLTLAVADVTDPAGVDRVLHGLGTGPRAVISTYGVPYSRHPITVYSEGAAIITRAMASHGIQRLVCVTSTTVAAEQVPGETLMWRKVVIPLLRRVLGRTLYDDMARMEDIVTSSDLDWLIVRPAGLFDADSPSNDYQVSAQRSPGRRTSRPDLAQVLLNEATQPQHSRCAIEVLTRAIPPRQAAAFLKEAFGGRR
ncbi:NAD(P)-dependent oxidoreductase [Catenuloplanes atrovinosus]|uniref:NADH-flavin reductase n=1 Tax=Catenuloplanes atrovinosus TaxID=137266 RepID=A0AAE4CD65_9ACTN|nr:NAD(P)H-binding protein [Catenuloplanes atrovinosus]MDR7277215.1 putative NADH-flavin reductase [Catenuloplanes atrovinosus]